MNVTVVRMESQGFAEIQRQSQDGYIKVKTCSPAVLQPRGDQETDISACCLPG